MTMVVLGLGTNMGDRKHQLTSAVKALGPLLSDMVCSAVYESQALLPEGAPKEWNIAFYNMAVCGETKLAPHTLLMRIKAIEESLGRTPRGHWGPREIDIDILAYGTESMMSDELTVPHPALLKRDFALIPLASIVPEWLHPTAKKSASELAALMPSSLIKTDIVLA